MADHKTAGDVATALVAEVYVDTQEMEEEDEELSIDIDYVSGALQSRSLVWLCGLSLTTTLRFQMS